MRYRHIIFDCDGVLVDTEIIAAKITVPVLNSLGLNISLQQYLSTYTGQTFKAIFDPIVTDPRVNKEMLIKNIEEKVYQHIPPVPGIVEVIKSISMPKSVVSNSGIQQIEQSLKGIHLIDHFYKFYSSSMVALPKPSPLIYQHALKDLNIDADECIVVEDSISGVTAALASGTTVIGFTGGSHIQHSHTQKLKDLGVTHIAGSADELLIILKALL